MQDEKETAAPPALRGIHATGLTYRKGGTAHRKLDRGFAGQDGQAAVEYAVILGLVTAILIAAYASLGETCLRLVNNVVSAFSS